MQNISDTITARLKILIKVFIIFICLIALVLLSVRLYFRLPVSEYYKASHKTFVIPGNGTGYIAQGLAYDEEADCFLMCGYQKDGSASPIYQVRKTGKTPDKKVFMYLVDGSAYTGHAGGLTKSGEYIYVADGGSRRLLVFSYKEFCSTPDQGKLTAIGEFSTKATDTDYIKPAFVYSQGDRLITGEFYREEQYPTPDSHKVTTLSGEYQQALAVEYRFDADRDFGIDPEPVCVYSMPDQVQGLCMDNGNIYLSTSWGTSKSVLYQFEESRLARQEDIAILGRTLPLYALDTSALVQKREIAPMAEEIVILDGMMYTMCESASDKYIFGKFTSAKWCYATAVEEFFHELR